MRGPLRAAQADAALAPQPCVVRQVGFDALAGREAQARIELADEHLDAGHAGRRCAGAARERERADLLLESRFETAGRGRRIVGACAFGAQPERQQDEHHEAAGADPADRAAP